jgi:hypothetical protein
MNFLHIAYAATWIIHVSYLGLLVRRYSRLRKDIDALNKK